MTARAVQASKELLARLPSWRLLFQGRCLVFTNTLGGGVLMAVGDSLQQTREMRMETGRVRDWRRTGSMFLVGCSMGLIEHYWYCWLDRLCVGRTMTTVLKKVAIDQLICGPGIGLWYFIGMALTEGHSVKEGCMEFKEKFVEYTTANLCVWPLAQTINFYYLHPKFCVMYINVVSLGWNTYLSYLKHRGNGPPTVMLDSGPKELQCEAPPVEPPMEKAQHTLRPECISESAMLGPRVSAVAPNRQTKLACF